MEGACSPPCSALGHSRRLDRRQVVRLRTCLQCKPVLGTALLLDVVPELCLQRRSIPALKICSTRQSLGLEPCVLGHGPIDALSGHGANASGFRAGGRELELSRGVAVLLGQAVLALGVGALDRIAHEQRPLAVGCDP